MPNGPISATEPAPASGAEAGTRRPPGRPRSEPVRRAILEASLGLIARDGYAALTMEGIAREAGVSKQTVYRWWPSKAAVVLEAAGRRASSAVPGDDQGALEADVRSFVRATVLGLTPQSRRVLAALMAEAQLDPAFGEAFRARFIADRRRAFRAVLERAQVRREVGLSADLELLADLPFGALWYRLLNEHAPLDEAFAEGLARAVAVAARGR